MLVTTTMDVERYEVVEYLGVVRGLIVRAPTISQGFLAALKNLIGGRIGGFTSMCEQARRQAYESMVATATKMGANAIIGMRYDASQVSGGRISATEVLCYGTAVIVRPSESGPLSSRA